jgi:hypothetical protein
MRCFNLHKRQAKNIPGFRVHILFGERISKISIASPSPTFDPVRVIFDFIIPKSSQLFQTNLCCFVEYCREKQVRQSSGGSRHEDQHMIVSVQTQILFMNPCYA